MKVAIIHNLYPPYAKGGAEQVVFKTVQGLVEAGHEVVVITLAPGKEEKPARNASPARIATQSVADEHNDAGGEINGNVTIYRIHPRNIFSYLDSHTRDFFSRLLWHVFDIWNKSSKKSIQNILQQEKPDVVHTHNFMGIGFLIPRLIRKMNIPHVHTVHDVQLVEPSGIILKEKEHSFRYTGLMTQLYASLMRSLLGSPNVVISPSQFLLQFYEKWGFFKQSNRVVLRNPVLIENTPQAKQLQPVFTFLYVGQVEVHKGIIFLVQSFCNFLKATKIPCELHIVGTGSQMNILTEMAQHEPGIYIHGKVDHHDLPSFFAKADITIVPSLCYENSPTVIFESFSYHTPVLASNIEGIAELIKEGENGLTFIAGNEASLLQKLQWCVEHRSDVSYMGEKGRSGILDLSREKYLEKLLALYQGVEREVKD